MADISACNGVGKSKFKNHCPIREGCKRYDVHLNAASKRQSYIKSAFVGQSCEFLKE